MKLIILIFLALVLFAQMTQAQEIAGTVAGATAGGVIGAIQGAFLGGSRGAWAGGLAGGIVGGIYGHDRYDREIIYSGARSAPFPGPPPYYFSYLIKDDTVHHIGSTDTSYIGKLHVKAKTTGGGFIISTDGKVIELTTGSLETVGSTKKSILCTGESYFLTTDGSLYGVNGSVSLLASNVAPTACGGEFIVTRGGVAYSIYSGRISESFSIKAKRIAVVGGTFLITDSGDAFQFQYGSHVWAGHIDPKTVLATGGTFLVKKDGQVEVFWNDGHTSAGSVDPKKLSKTGGDYYMTIDGAIHTLYAGSNRVVSGMGQNSRTDFSQVRATSSNVTEKSNLAIAEPANPELKVNADK